jgi:gliding motility-associated-like protein
VNDATPPVISNIPVDMSFNATGSCEVIPNWTEPTASDNCTVTYFASDHGPSDPFPLGITKVTYTARDDAGNETIRSFNVTVNDVTPPTITGCTDVVVDASPASCDAVVNWNALSIADNCTELPFISSNYNSGDTFPVGTTLVTYEATDESGNKSVCSFTVTVNDVTGPEFNGELGNVTASSESTSNGAMVQWTVPDVLDNCGSITEVTPDHSPGDHFTIGSTQVTYTLKDGNNNSSSYSFVVIVNDVTPPVLQNCPSEIHKSVDPGRCYATVTWVPPTAQDNSGSPITPIASSNPGQFALGTTPVEYTATDPSGNVTNCTFNIIVTSSEAPVISGCPEDIITLANEDGEANVNWEPPTASTSCGEVALTSSHAPGDLFAVGNTTVKYFAANDPTKKALCAFTVTVKYRDLEINPLQIVTPNGDGVNDEWIVSNLENFSQNYVTIFDRWGSVIYRATGYNNSTVVWNGTNTSGTRVPNGTYFYNIRVSYREQQLEENGFIELVEQ